MLAKLLPRSCSSLSVFVSYSHEQRPLAEEVAQALVNAGHSVFFDRDSIPGSGDYVDRIHSAIESADRLVFLASKPALQPGKFTMTELQFAKDHWPSPADRVFPVIVDETVAVADLPPYLRSVSVMSVAGNAPAEIVAAVHKTRRVGRLCKTVTAAALAFLVGAPVVAAYAPRLFQPQTELVLLPPQKIHFRSKTEAPMKEVTAATANWADSDVTITVMPVAFSHRTEPGRRARILEETLDVAEGSESRRYRALYVVEITDQPCGERWYCIKANAGPETLDPGKSISRETLFVPVKHASTRWSTFVDRVLAGEALPLTVTYRAKIEVSESSGLKQQEMVQACRIDTKLMKTQMLAAGFKAGGDSKPVFLEPDCNPIAAVAATQ